MRQSYYSLWPAQCPLTCLVFRNKYKIFPLPSGWYDGSIYFLLLKFPALIYKNTSGLTDRAESDICLNNFFFLFSQYWKIWWIIAFRKLKWVGLWLNKYELLKNISVTKWKIILLIWANLFSVSGKHRVSLGRCLFFWESLEIILISIFFLTLHFTIGRRAAINPMHLIRATVLS